MRYRSRILAVLAAAAMGVGLLGGCGTTEDTDTVDTVDAAVSEESREEALAEEAVSSIDLTRLMGNGINLGNTMEAYGHTTLGVGLEASAYETYWGQPVTTQEMISGMKAAGFDTLRIPVAWTNAMDFESGDYTIGQDYLDRVEEIINYALNEDMYVIVNDHWDGGWWGMFGSASEETRTAAMDLYISMWTQIADRYEQYGSHLIFESGNEELGYRLNDTDIAADSGTLSDDECYEMVNQINQTFVDTIRGAGGNNADRFLLIAGFGTDITNTCDDRYVMPQDTAEDKLLISVHYYDPSGYCINTSLSSWGTKKDYEDQNSMLEMMTKFTDMGIGVVIGEYGVLLDSGTLKDNTLEYTTNFLNNCDVYGYCPVLWDCNDLYNRSTCQLIDEEMAALYLDHSFAEQGNSDSEEVAAEAQAQMQAALEAAPDAAGLSDDQAIAWIMYTSSDWSIQYSVGDEYAPESGTEGVVATDVEITGEGTYTVALDFTGTWAGAASGVTFSALAVGNGEILYPGYCIEIKEVLINGEKYTLTGRPYTTSDDNKCTRLNLYNAWVSAVPDSARTASGNVMYVSPCVLDAETLGSVETIEITFDYVPGK